MLLGQVGRLLKEINSANDTKQDDENASTQDTDKTLETDKSQAKEQSSEQVGICDSTQEDQRRTGSCEVNVNKVDGNKSERSQEDDSVAMETSTGHGGKEGKKWKGKRKIETVGCINNMMQAAKTSSIIFILSCEILL